MNKLFLLLLLVLMKPSLFAQQPPGSKEEASFYILDSQIQIHDLRPFTYALKDKSNSLDVADITSGTHGNDFKAIKNFGLFNNNTTYWVRLCIKTKGRVTNWPMLLRSTSPDYFISNSGSVQYNDVQVFFCDSSGNVQSRQLTGNLVPRSKKQVRSNAAISQVLFSGVDGQKQVIYLRLHNTIGTTYPPYIEIHHPAVLLPTGSGDRLISVQGGIMFFFALFSFCLFFFVKDKAYLFFGIYTFLLTQVYLTVHSRMPFIDWYIPEHPQWYVYFDIMVVPGIFIFFLLFGRSFINLPALSKQTDKLMVAFIGLWIAFAMGQLVWYISGKPNSFYQLINLCFTIITFAFVIRFAFFKNIFARLFIIGGLWLLCFSIVGFLDNMFRFMPFPPFPVGQLGQLLIFAVALAYKIKLNEQSRAEAESIKDIDDIKSRFFANISHEFRTPLTLIQGPLQQIEQQARGNSADGFAEVSLRQVHTMRRYTDRLLELVNQLLDLSKLDSGKMKLQVIKGDVLQIIRVLAASFESIAERKQIHYYFNLPEQTSITFFDKDKLEKIVTNLLANAFKYTPEKGTVSLNVEFEENRIRIEVADSGPGILKKDLLKVFDRFYQVEGSEDKGTGIGLALVKELVDLYGGQISVNSEPGKGSRFRVSLPVGKNAFDESELVYGEWTENRVHIDHERSWYEEGLPLTPGLAAHHLPLVLIVEDNDDLRQFIHESIKNEYQVIEAADGHEGLERAIAEIPDLVISDVMMPAMNGFDMTMKLKTNERTSHIPIILLTAKAGNQHKVEGLQTGADDYLTKPFDTEELRTRMQNLILQRKLLRKKFAGRIQLKPSEIAVNSADERFLANVMEAIEKNMGEDEFGVEELAREVAMSRSQLHRKLIALTNQAPSEVIRNTRLLRAKELLSGKFATPSEVAFKVGFNSHSYFSKCFKEEFGISPGEIV